MNRNHTIGTLTLAITFLFSANVLKAENTATHKSHKSAPVFSEFSYQGKDPLYANNPLKADEFYNPILQGCYPDPSICRKGNDYYLVTSSFAYFPGVPIFHSKDLVNWTSMGHVLDRTSQLKVTEAGMAFGVYAPTIRYNKNNDTFYMITTQFAGGINNMIVKTKDPAKGWSDPIKLQFDGIDPSIFFDDNGKAYVVHNDAPAKSSERYNGHRVIKVWEYDIEKDCVIPGTDKVIVNGGVDIEKNPIWIEAPHMYKKDGYYYLMCAEGGTGGNHSEVVFISQHPTGPYTPAPGNPILTQRHLPANRPNKVDWAGHADIVDTPDGEYYSVFLAIRPNEKGRVNTGRETFMLPVDWSGAFPVFTNGLIALEPKLKMPKGVTNQTGKNGFFPSGNFTFQDNFQAENLDYSWISVRGPREAFISTTKKGIQITPFTEDITAKRPTATLFRRQQHLNFTTTVRMEYAPQSTQDMAGLVCYQNEDYNYTLGITRKDKDFVLLLVRTEKGHSVTLAEENLDTPSPIFLQVDAQGDHYRFSYSTDGKAFKNIGGTVSGDILSTNVAGGFTGALVGLYATSGNKFQ